MAPGRRRCVAATLSCMQRLTGTSTSTCPRCQRAVGMASASSVRSLLPPPPLPCGCVTQVKVLSPQEAQWAAEKGTIVVDVRPAELFAKVGRAPPGGRPRPTRVCQAKGFAGLGWAGCAARAVQ